MAAFAAPPCSLTSWVPRPATVAGRPAAPARLAAARSSMVRPPTAVLAVPRTETGTPCSPANTPDAARVVLAPASPVTTLHSAQELAAALSADVSTPGAPEAVSVIKFFAPYCRSCAGVRVKYERMASAYAAAAAEDAEDEPIGEDAASSTESGQLAAVTCYEMDYSRHGELCTRLGVDRLPYFMVIRGGRLLFGEAVAWNRFSDVRLAVDAAVHPESSAAGDEVAPTHIGELMDAAMTADAA
ncbi:hypothetical protein MMPV_002948 [Pyropia vietnamensis]